jgi:hypothetical protein
MSGIADVFQFEAKDISFDQFVVEEGDKQSTETGWSRPLRFRAKEDGKSMKYAVVDFTGCNVIGDQGAQVSVRRQGKIPETKKWSANQKSYEVNLIVPEDAPAVQFFQGLEETAREAIEKWDPDFKCEIISPFKKAENGDVYFVKIPMNTLTRLFVPGLVQDFTAVETFAKNPLPKNSRVKSAFINPLSVYCVRKDGINKAYINFGCAYMLAMKPRTGDEKIQEMLQGSDASKSMAKAAMLSKSQVMAMMGMVDGPVEEEEDAEDEPVTPTRAAVEPEAPGAPKKKKQRSS